MKLLFLSLLLFAASIVQAQHEHDIYLHDPGSSYREHNIDIQHQRIEVSFDTLQNKVFGEVLHTWTVKRNSIDSIILDAPGIDIKSVKIDRKQAEFRSTEESLIIYVNNFEYGTKHTS
jgi:aminopeptidase N